MGFIGKGLFEGMAVTARNFVGSYFDKERLVTVQYPEERVQVPENSRTFPFLVFDKDSDPVASMRCESGWGQCPSAHPCAPSSPTAQTTATAS